MLFNSQLFIFLFLPVTLAVVFGLSRAGARDAAKVALFTASVVFYGFWNPKYVLLLFTILVVNYGTARLLIRLAAREGEGAPPSRARTAALIFGLSLNVGALAYFKYTNFVVNLVNGALTHELHVGSVVLPLGISFITFQKIALLVDVYSGTVPSLRLLDYCLFVTFFPQLIAGPIVHHREVIPQFSRRESLRAAALPLASGVTLFVIGLSKKVLLADSIAPAATAVYAAAASGSRLDFFTAWSGAVHYLFQLYFDFSGYSDMAIGLGMMFGIELPVNFNSPYKAVGFVDYWQRWHITLTRFLTAYVYNPVVLRLSRRRALAGKKSLVKGRMLPGAFITLLAIPTLFTMFISGLWHGAGFQFIVFGLLHGVYLVIDHAVRTFRKKPKGKAAPPSTAAVAAARALTLLGVLVGSVFFRADSVRAALRVLKGMTGLAGIGRPELQRDPLRLAFLLALIVGTQILPNSQEILGRWRPSVGWGIVVAAVGFVAVIQISDSSVFLYFNF